MDVKIIRSNRKTVSIQVGEDLGVTVRAPRYASRREIDRILKEKEDWIENARRKVQEKKALYASEEEERLTGEEIDELADRAMEYIPGRVKYFAGLIGVTYGHITIRNQKTRWGSCSSKGNLNFNCLLMLAPEKITDYVIVHELCHRKEMNHSKAFWSEVEKILPDYKTSEKWLKTEGNRIMRRMR